MIFKSLNCFFYFCEEVLLNREVLWDFKIIFYTLFFIKERILTFVRRRSHLGFLHLLITKTFSHPGSQRQLQVMGELALMLNLKLKDNLALYDQPTLLTLTFRFSICYRMVYLGILPLKLEVAVHSAMLIKKT